MPEEIRIPEDSLAGFSQQARKRLREATAEYATDLIEEANRIEAGRNSTNGSPEVTRGMIDDARILLRRGLGAPKKGRGIKILRVSAAVLPLFVGILYDRSELQNGSYMLLFILALAAAIVVVTISVLRE